MQRRRALRAGQMPLQRFQMRHAPGGDVLVIVAIRDGPANDEQQHLGQRMQDAPQVARVRHMAEMIEQRGRVWAEKVMAWLRIRASASIQTFPDLSPET